MNANNKMRTLVAASSVTIASVGIASANANAAPAPINSPVTYHAKQVGDSAVVTANGGSYTVNNGVLQFLDNAGKNTASFPLAYRVKGQQFPIDAQIAGKTVTLTYSKDQTRAISIPDAPVSAVHHFTQGETAAGLTLPGKINAADATTTRNQTAFSQFASAAGISSVLSAIGGAILAGTIGCALGLAAGAALTLGTLGVLLPAPVAGCLVGAVALAPVGTLVGLIFIGAPLLAAAAIQYFVTVNTPLPPEKPANTAPKPAPKPAR